MQSWDTRQSTSSGDLFLGGDGSGGGGWSPMEGWGEGKCVGMVDSPKSSADCLTLSDFIDSGNSPPAHSTEMFWHQFSIATSSPKSLGFIEFTFFCSAPTIVTSLNFVAASRLACSKISFARELVGIEWVESGGLPLGRQSEDPGPASQVSLEALQFVNSRFFEPLISLSGT
jgi:hypothetical protein